MTVGLWVKVPPVVWAIVGVLLTPTFAHNTHGNPYLDPEAYEDSRITLRHHIPLNQVDEETELSDDLAIQVNGGRQEAIELADYYGLQYMDQLFENPAIFHLRANRQFVSGRERPRRDVTEGELVEAISKEPGVEWVDQQVAFIREKRRIHSLYPDQDQRQRNTHQGERKRGYHKIPADVLKSRRALNKLLQNPPNEADKSKQDRRKESGTVSDYWKEDLAIESRSLDGHFDTLRHINLPVNRQHQRTLSQDQKSSSDDLVRIPLSQNVGYGLEPARTSFRNHEEGHRDTSYRIPSTNSQSPQGRIYIPRDWQLKNNIELVSESERNERGGGDFAIIPQNNSTNEDFGEWIDQLVESSVDFSDPFYNDQWYLHNTGQLGRMGHDLNVTWAWHKGYTGRGIVLSVLDDGLQTTNADIADNYAPNVSYSVVRDEGPKDDPSPRMDPSFSNSHGTYCAAIMSAVSNNSVCGVGVAYDSKVGAVRIVDGRVTDVQEATALSRHIDQVDVFSASWGPTDDGTKVEGPARLAQHAFLEGITKGRGGRGVIYVWASGNGGIVGDNCNLDGYTSSIYTLSISALTDIGTSTFYEEPCASTLAAVYVGGEHTLEDALDRKRSHDKKLRVVVPELDGHCSEDFQGTSAAAPLMAGIVALVLQANGNLTWRDVQHLVVETSSPTPSALEEYGWQTNGHGKKFHLMQGFGAVNGGKMVEAALNWQNVKPQDTIILPMFNGYRDFHPLSWMNVSRVLDSSEVPSYGVMPAVEHVIANVTISHPKRKLLTIFIISPSGTTSQVLTHRGPDDSNAGFRYWGFMSVHFWGEDPQGQWTVAIKDNSGEKGFLKGIELIIYGS